MTNDKTCRPKELEKLIGKLGRLSMIIPGSSAFIVAIRQAFYSTSDGWAILNQTCEFDLSLWLETINLGTEGVPLEKLLLRLPSATHFTDASGKGMGGYHMETGCVWNYPFPSGILEKTTINHLEFFAIIVDLLLEAYHNHINGNRVLIWIDNQSAVCWLKRKPRSDYFTF